MTYFILSCQILSIII